MNATELSEQIKQHLEAGEWAQAAAMLTLEWNTASDFGVLHCDRPEYPEVWVRFKTSGYPFKLRREWDNTESVSARLAMIIPHIADWNLPDIIGQNVPLDGAARDATLFDEIDDLLVMWIVFAFTRFWLYDLAMPRKNSSPPSAIT